MNKDRRSNPYVGPRAFQKGEKLYGRAREQRELLDLLIAERIVLMHSPSGAGKTSLIQASLIPMLEEEGFHVLPVVRVNEELPPSYRDREGLNRYSISCMLSLAQDGPDIQEADIDQLSKMTLAEYLTQGLNLENLSDNSVLIFDQFEEVLSVDPTDHAVKFEFFAGLGKALQEQNLWALFAIREDYLAAIQEFQRAIPTRFKNTYHLDFLTQGAARQAIKEPALELGVAFQERAAQLLVDDLRRVRVQYADGRVSEEIGRYVEPVQLQVVCYRLWQSLAVDDDEISVADVEALGNVDRALGDYYDEQIQEIIRETRAGQKAIRDWFEDQLITEQGIRSQVLMGSERSGNLDNRVVRRLEDAHLVRAERRRGATWYELAHDRLVDPIVEANRLWREKRQRPLRIGIVALFLLAVLSLLYLNFQSSQQAQNANQIANQAEAAAETATALFATSEAQVTADYERIIAQQTAVAAAGELAKVAVARQLAAQAQSDLEENPDLALLLSIEAAKRANSAVSRQEASVSLFAALNAVSGGSAFQVAQQQVETIRSFRFDQRLTGPDGFVFSVEFSPDSRTVAFGGESLEGGDHSVVLWDLETGTEKIIGSHSRRILSVSFNNDGTLLASSSGLGDIILWDLAKGEQRGEPLLEHQGLVASIDFSPDGKLLASGGWDEAVRIWDVERGVLRDTFRDLHRGTIWSVAWSPNGDRLASASEEGVVKVWDPVRGYEIDAVESKAGTFIRTLAWAPDGRSVAFGDQDGWVYLWNVEHGEAGLNVLGGHRESIISVAFSPDGNLLASGSDDRTMRLWDVKTQAPLGEPIAAQGNNSVRTVGFSPNGKFLASGGTDGTVGLWAFDRAIRDVAFSPDGKMVRNTLLDKVELRSADSGNLEARWEGNKGNILALAYSPDRSTLATAGEDGQVLLWDLNTGNLIGSPLTGVAGNVLSLAFSADGNLLAAGSDKQEVLLWYADPVLGSFSEVTSLPLSGHIDEVISLTFRSQDQELLSIDARGIYHVWDLSSIDQDSASLESLPPILVSGSIYRTNEEELAISYNQAGQLAEEQVQPIGIDISKFTYPFDASVNPEGIDFIIVRASGGLAPDSSFEENYKAVQPVNIRGAYHFFAPDKPWLDQANVFLSLIEGKNFNFLVLDFEGGFSEITSQAARDAQQWMSYVAEATELPVMLYTSAGVYNDWLSPFGDWMSQWPLWIANPLMGEDQELLNLAQKGQPFLPVEVSDWSFWQFSLENRLGYTYGVQSKSIDLNIFNGTYGELFIFAEFSPFEVADVDFREDGVLLAVTSPEGIISLFNVETEVLIARLTASSGRFQSADFNPDGTRLVSGSEDGRIAIWDMSLLDEEPDLAYWVEVACAIADRNLTTAEWNQYIGSEITQEPTCGNLSGLASQDPTTNLTPTPTVTPINTPDPTRTPTPQ